MPPLDGGPPDGDGQVRLAHAGWAEQKNILGERDEAAAGELSDERRVDGRLELEVEPSSVLTEGKWAIWMPMATRLRCLASVSSATTRS